MSLDPKSLEVYADVITERRRALAEHGDDSAARMPADDPRLPLILFEEVGEVAQAALEDPGNLYAELIQVAAVALTWAEKLVR